jgi:hypothetical protein
MRLKAERRAVAEFDLAAHVERSRQGPCFVCAYLCGHPGYRHEHIFLDDHVVVHSSADIRHCSGTQSLRLAEALKAVLPTERIYLMALGSHQGNADVHWHVAPPPPGVLYERQQFHAVMAENGVLEVAAEQQASFASKIRSALQVQLSS